MKVHILDPNFAYDETQTNDDINDGDTLVAGEVVGFLYKAWPVAVTKDFGQFHQIAENFDPTKLEDVVEGAIANAIEVANEKGAELDPAFQNV